MTVEAPATGGSIVRSVAIAAGLALPAALGVYALGTTLGLFFGGLVVVTLVLPPMVLLQRDWTAQVFVASAVNDAVGMVWLLAALTPQVSLTQWLMCYLVLAAYSFALWAMVRMLRRARMSAIPAAALTVVVAMLWLTWPIWLARHGGARAADWLVPAHPPLAINGAISHLGIWTERPIAYNHLLNLGQDVAYRLPDGVLAAVFVHLIAGGLLFASASALPERAAREDPMG